jgi:hypothetical protein
MNKVAGVRLEAPQHTTATAGEQGPDTGAEHSE